MTKQTREELADCLSIPLNDEAAIGSLTKIEAAADEADLRAAERERIRDRAGDDLPPLGAGSARK